MIRLKHDLKILKLHVCIIISHGLDIQIHDFPRRNPTKFHYFSLRLTPGKIKTRHLHTTILYVPDSDNLNMKISKETKFDHIYFPTVLL